MKVLHVVGDSAFGGGSKIVLSIAEAVRAHGHEVHVLTTDAAFAEEVRRRRLVPVELECIWRPIRPWRDLQGLRRLTAYLRANHYDLVHTHTSKAGFVGRLAAHRAAVPAIVHTVHGFAFHERSRLPVIWAYASLERLAARWCHRVVTVSGFHRRWALRLRIGDEARVRAICNGIADAPVVDHPAREAIRASLGIPAGALVVISGGRLAAGKGLFELLDAFAVVKRRVDGPSCLLLPGRGPLETALRQRVAALGLTDDVVMPGFRDDVRELVGASDIVALPSVREGLSIALLEAMAAGKPILASEIGSNREATDDGRGALLVKVGSADDVARGLLLLATDAACAASYARAAADLFNSRYREATMLADYCRLYGELGVDCRHRG